MLSGFEQRGVIKEIFVWSGLDSPNELRKEWLPQFEVAVKTLRVDLKGPVNDEWILKFTDLERPTQTPGVYEESVFHVRTHLNDTLWEIYTLESPRFRRTIDWWLSNCKKREKRFIDGQRTPCLTLDAAYPVLTRRSGKGYWQPGNWAAYLRTIDIIRAMKFDIVGEYHSHIEDVAELSEDDLGYIEAELEAFERKSIKIYYWIEIVLNIKKKEYEHEQTPKCN